MFTSARVVSWIAARFRTRTRCHFFASRITFLRREFDPFRARETARWRFWSFLRSSFRFGIAAPFESVKRLFTPASMPTATRGSTDSGISRSVMKLNPDPDRGLHDPDCLDPAVYVSTRAEVTDPLDADLVSPAGFLNGRRGNLEGLDTATVLETGEPRRLPRLARGERTPGTPCPGGAARIAGPKPGNHCIR